ncbi:HAD family hydrolase [bacterium]|nr:HAD family hydrolase [bacterium]
MTIELLIFDCDGVLVDSEPIANRILAEELTRIGLPTTCEESIQRYMGKSEADCLQMITEQLGRVPPPDLLDNYHSRTEAAFARELKAVDGIHEALTRLPYAKCVGSSGSHAKIRSSLRQTGLETFFKDQIFSATDVERGKPHPDLFLYAADKMGASPGNCIVIEDAVPGVRAAVAAGITVFGYAALMAPLRLEAAGAEVFTRMADLPQLLSRLCLKRR